MCVCVCVCVRARACTRTSMCVFIHTIEFQLIASSPISF